MQRNPLIAVVDDDAGICEAIAELLEVLGYESARYSGGEAFLVDLPRRSFDCLVSDVRMPGMDGFELARRAALLAPELPIIIVSSIDAVEVRSRAARMGAVAFLRKPLDVDDFQRTLALALRRSGPAS